MLRSPLLLATGLATSLISCAATPTDNAPSGPGGGKADGDSPTITFAADFSESVHGALVAGTSVRIAYDLERLQTCRGSTNGRDAWGVSGYAQFDSGEPVAFELSRIVDHQAVHYDPARLAQCAGSTGGHAAWGITAHWQVDGGADHTLAVARTDGTTLVAADPALTIPHGADLALWFEATNVWGCHAYDSAYGANYHAAIEP